MVDRASTMELQTARLRMRPLVLADLDDLFRLRADPEVSRYIGVRNRDETAVALASFVDHWREYGFGIWALKQAETSRFVGRCGLRRATEVPDVELAYTLHKEFWGKGFATEASRAALRFGFETVGIDRIIAFAVPDNRASTRVMEKLGMRYEKRAPFHGLDHVWYAISRAEYTASCPTN
jgi:RimJ/RimL family protein N-acetyltransferase